MPRRLVARCCSGAALGFQVISTSAGEYSPESRHSKTDRKRNAVMSDEKSKAFVEFEAYWRLGEEMIANATKEDLAEALRILAMQSAHYARKYGELQLPDLTDLLN